MEGFISVNCLSTSQLSGNDPYVPDYRGTDLFNLSMGLGSSSQPVDMTSSIAKFVKDTIATEDIVIFSKTYCPYCKMAKQVFDSLKTSYVAVELDTRDDAEDIQKVLGEITGAKTVPRVFVKGECLGGGSDVKALHENGKLQELLKA